MQQMVLELTPLLEGGNAIKDITVRPLQTNFNLQAFEDASVPLRASCCAAILYFSRCCA